MKYNKFIMLLCVCLTFSVTGCTSIAKSEYEETLQSINTEKKEIDIKPTSGGTLNIAIRNPKTLNPLINEDESIDQVLKLIYDDLIILDENQKPTPNIASTWQLAQDGISLTLSLRNDITWHNGTSLTAKDVIFSLDTIAKSQETSAYKACINNISSYSKIDDYTVLIIYKQPFLGSVYSLNFPIISQDYYKNENILLSDKNMIPMGTSAYEFYSFDTMKQLNLKKNSNWFKGSPYIDNIRAEIIPKKDAELYSFAQKQIDVLNTDVVDWEKYNGDKEAEYVTNSYNFIGINFNNSILNDKTLRQALAYAIPKEKIIEEIYLGHAISTDTPINPKSWLSFNKDLKYTYNINTSKELLKQSGWEDLDQNGILEKDGKELTFSLLVNEENVQRTETAKIIQDTLKQIGIEVTIVIQNYENYTNKLKTKDFETFLGEWKLSIIPDFSFAFHSSQIAAGNNFISYSNSDMDNLLHQAFVATTEASMIESYKNLENHIIEELPYISLYFRNASVLTSSRVKGELTSNMNNVFLGIENWFIYDDGKKFE